MALKRIRLELARAPEARGGNPYCGYEFTAPLDSAGKLDLEQWARNKDKCLVRRFWNSTTDERGRLVHQHGGHWAFAWPGEDREEPIFRYDKHAFVTGEYVSVTEHDGIERPFCIVDIKPAD
ncbi:hypothetical protein [Reyranella sp.]|uniref:hypothetical protein n=1 Tax=Reyranella sp. TaxID=1929291 RepID=UPI003D0A17BD